jgi:hypothetical protein
MPRQIAFEFAGYPNEIVATLLDEEVPEFAEKLWQDLATPLKMWPWHTTSTGDWFSSKARPSPHPQALGSQAMPIGKPKLMCDLVAGEIVYSGAKVFSYAYGPDITEPLATRGPVAARADDLDEFFKAGRHVWEAQYRTHQLVIVTARRIGG